MEWLKITDEMRAAARKLLRNRALKFSRPDHDLLTAIADGTRKQIRPQKWTKHFARVDQMKLDKLERMADPARNPMAHERAIAADMVVKFQAGRAPGLPPEPPPLPDMSGPPPRKGKPQAQPRRRLPSPDDGVKHGGVKQDAAATGRGGVKQKPKPKRTGDRHLNKGDRHKPGYMREYMREYMRRRRAKLRTHDKAARRKK